MWNSAHRTMWIALLLALAFLAADSVFRTRAILDITSSTLREPLPDPVPVSPTGYAGGRHRLILPALATDGYHWILQAERMLDRGEPRVREVAYDNAPSGRDVHWSGSMRWWLTAAAGAYRTIHRDLSMPQALERVAPWANTALLACLLVVLTPILGARLGSAAGALFVLGCVAIFPFYQAFAAGLLDHHGLAAICCLAGVLFLICGGAGWVRADDPIGIERPANAVAPRSGARHTGPVESWLVTRSLARSWFIASAISLGAGLWVSAATIVPVLAGIGLGALAGGPGALAGSSGAPGHGDAHAVGWRAVPELWRVWGIAGAITSIAFYLIEYFPAHMGMRLEVNHPLYALAWLGAGDMLARIGALRMRDPGNAGRTTGALRVRDPGSAGRRIGAVAWLVDALLIALLPAVMLIDRGTFLVADRFLWALHEDYIFEFRSLGSQFSLLSPWQLFQGTTNLLPLVLLPVAALLWPTPLAGRWRTAWRGVVGGMVAAGVIYFHGFVFTSVAAVMRAVGLLPSNPATASMAVQLLSLVPDAAAFALLFRWPLRHAGATVSPPVRALLATAALPAALLLLLTFAQVRWLGVSNVLLIAATIALAAAVRVGNMPLVRKRTLRVAAGLFLVLVFAPSPLFTMLFPWREGYPTIIDEAQVVTRDVAYMLDDRLGSRAGVVASGPTTTSWLIWFGGLRGVGTLYWENLAGLKTTAAIYGARTADEARTLIDRHGVTHIVVFSWDPFAREYARLARGERLERRNPGRGPDDAFILRLLRSDTTPDWLERIPYALPERGLLRDAAVWIFEVVPAT